MRREQTTNRDNREIISGVSRKGRNEKEKEEVDETVNKFIEGKTRG